MVQLCALLWHLICFSAHNGTLLFTSLDAHRGCSPSFRGDLEILGYNILYWLCGTLPWQKCAQKPEAVKFLFSVFVV